MQTRYPRSLLAASCALPFLRREAFDQGKNLKQLVGESVLRAVLATGRRLGPERRPAQVRRPGLPDAKARRKIAHGNSEHSGDGVYDGGRGLLLAPRRRAFA